MKVSKYIILSYSSINNTDFIIDDNIIYCTDFCEYKNNNKETKKYFYEFLDENNDIEEAELNTFNNDNIFIKYLYDITLLDNGYRISICCFYD